ncbi:uncharacterized protein LOC113214809 [Frankliniella occidentalis]|uniref:Uncharacterized protein LOC113214809 n=1 Tax=Frankliniella occidentalis TaxID=133901 RepID=A0A6J1T9V7_FRAOC|nr:uncharacterized protein LOC113214809 [Frankliniella occidentalis]XP_052131230.1 uncharacterized protein LOC113214809 [Frankliniella occidentalis]
MRCLRLVKNCLTSGVIWPQRRMSSSVICCRGEAAPAKVPIKWLQQSSVPYKIVVLERATLESEEMRPVYPPPTLSKELSEQELGEDPLVVGIMLDVIGEEFTIATKGTAPRTVIITLYPPDSEPDSLLDSIYCPSRP